MVVGTTCAPCSEIFALNFAGAVKDVSCEEFLQSIERRNEECNGCIQKFNLDG